MAIAGNTLFLFDDVQSPKLASPSGSLPWLEQQIARYVLFPKYDKQCADWQAACFALEHSVNDMRSILSQVGGHMAETRALVRPISGLEHHARNWSVAQVLDHLAVVDRSIAGLIAMMANGDVARDKISAREIMPSHYTTMRDAERHWHESLQELMQVASIPVADYVTFDHPWLGPLSARQWLAFAVFHHAVHRRHIRDILSALA